ncbi:MAG: dimethyl sulfoxide reductase anchor subunit [Gammaproteobacteria bacterium]|nr:dimethyl sulfoxide reductase anchor subunit [Gammaproteobacteria bacterium]
MTPAYSVIFFTVASGAGYGLLTWLSVAYLANWWTPNAQGFVPGAIALCLGVVLIVAGLMSSMLHLGHPERAWRALSQWRTSWLSREGVLATLGLIPITLFVGGWLWAPERILMLRMSALATIVFSLSTVLCTAMIYASLKPIPRWHNPWVPPVYLGFALASGAVIAMCVRAFADTAPTSFMIGTLALLIGVWILKILYWRHSDAQDSTSTIGSATGLDALGDITQLDAPHTAANYLQKEMGFVVARKHATRLRRMAILLGAALPSLVLFEILMTEGFLHDILLLIGTASVMFSLCIERWLFFAEAKHVVTLFYGEKSV